MNTSRLFFSSMLILCALSHGQLFATPIPQQSGGTSGGGPPLLNVVIDQEVQTGESYDQTLERLLADPTIGVIQFVAGNTYVMEDVVTFLSSASGKTLIGNGAIVKRGGRLQGGSYVGGPVREMWLMEGAIQNGGTDPIVDLAINGFVFDFAGWVRDFQSIIQFRVGQFENISICNNLFIDSSNGGIDHDGGGQDCWMVNTATKNLNGEYGDSAVDGFTFEGNVGIAKAVGLTAGGGDGLYQNCYVQNNLVIRSDIALDLTVNATSNASVRRYRNVNFIGNTVINPMEHAFHNGLDSNNVHTSSALKNTGISDRYFDIDGFCLKDNQILYGRTAFHEFHRRAIIFRPGTDGPKRNIFIQDNDFRIQQDVDSMNFEVQHLGDKILVKQNGTSINFSNDLNFDGTLDFDPDTLTYPKYDLTAENSYSGSDPRYNRFEPNYEQPLDMTIGQFPTISTFPIPPENFIISGNTGRESSANNTGRSRIQTLNLNDGNAVEEAEGQGDCSEHIYTTLDPGDLQWVRNQVFASRIYHLDVDRKYPVLSKPISIDTNSGFRIEFNFYTNSACQHSYLFHQDEDNSIRLAPLHPEQATAGAIKIKVAGQPYNLIDSGLLAEHRSYRVVIDGQPGKIITTVTDFFDGSLVATRTLDQNATLDIRTIGARVNALYSSFDSTHPLDGYLWGLQIEAGGNLVADFDGVSNLHIEDEYWQNKADPQNPALLMPLDVYEFTGTEIPVLASNANTGCLDLKFKILPTATSGNRHIFFRNGGNQFLRVELGTGRLKMKAGPNIGGANDLKSLTPAGTILPGRAYHVHIEGFACGYIRSIQATVNGTEYPAVLLTEFDYDDFGFGQIGGGFGRPTSERFHGFIWDIVPLGTCVLPGYLGIEDGTGIWEDQTPNGLDATLTPFN